ncbi:MAG: DUF1016 N-terminal domain-containing protein [Propionibacteriaceae bacterium]|nr:DUF1016 N-terminal domain-containing protein [Propionibacteriaceae bacterium]
MPDLESVPSGLPLGDEGLYQAAARLIEEVRSAIAYHANAVTLVSNWRLGHLLHTETLQRGRAAYGKQILAGLSKRLMAQYGKGFDETTLNRMVKFAREYSESELAQLPPEVGWSHVRLLLPLESRQARAFYTGEVSAKRLGVRELETAIGRKAFERREIANAQIPEGSAVPLDTFKDPMLLHMTGTNAETTRKHPSV